MKKSNGENCVSEEVLEIEKKTLMSHENHGICEAFEESLRGTRTTCFSEDLRIVELIIMDLDYLKWVSL